MSQRFSSAFGLSTHPELPDKAQFGHNRSLFEILGNGRVGFADEEIAAELVKFRSSGHGAQIVPNFILRRKNREIRKMRHQRAVWMVVALAIFAVWTTNCEAFEAWGFISGTGQAAVENQAHLEGDEVKALGGVIAINRFDKASGTWSVLLLQFCDDRLFKIGKPRNINPPSAGIFLDTLYGYIEERGSPAVSVAHNLLPNGNSIEEIAYRWGGPPDTTSLIFSTPAQPMEDVIPGIREEHKDTSQCTKAPNDPR